jgi:osmotically-inducible protein OsmY
MNQGAPDEYLVAHASEALITDSRVAELGLHVSVSGLDVFVTGDVSTEDQRQAVSEVLQQVLPDHTIHNQVATPDLQEVGEPEELT